MDNITLTPGQQSAYQKFCRFLLNPALHVFVLRGYAGTGKSTLVRKLLEDLSAILRTGHLLTPDQKPRQWPVKLTATTNKAAEALANITGEDVETIHSVLKLRVHRNYRTNETELVVRGDADILEDTLLFIDEASYIDADLMKLIFSQTRNCKLVFIGDPAQLTPVTYQIAPIFHAGFDGAALTEVVRQAEGNPIIELATAFRTTVNEGLFFSFRPDGVAIQKHERDQFEQLLTAEFTRPDWKHDDSKVLAWTNRTVIGYNKSIRNLTQGVPDLGLGDYAICNHFISIKHCKLKTDQMVKVTSLEATTDRGVAGFHVGMNHEHYAFMPASLDSKRKALREAKQQEDFAAVRYINENWIDLRAAYACTINKSQGSTYDRVFIDLDDIKGCNSANQIARMMYVAVSRAREQVIFTGDLV